MVVTPIRIVAMAINKAPNPRMSTFPLNPSLYSTNTNPAKTRTVPASGWSRINPAGIPTIRNDRNRTLRLRHLVASRDRYQARRSAVVGLANSLGCKLIVPNPNQDRAPPIFLPTIKTATRRTSVTRYCNTEVLMKNSLSILRIKNPKNEQIKIHISCFPPFPFQSNHSEISRFEVALTTFRNPKNIRHPTRITRDQSMFLYMDDSLGVMAETLRFFPPAVYLKPYL